MKKVITSSFVILFVFQINAQVTIGSNTLPEIGDVLLYTTFTDFEDSLSYKTTGEDLEWSYDNFNVSGADSEGYFDIDTSALKDSFPEANMLVNFGGFQTAAFRSDSTIEVVGLPLEDLGGFGGFGGDVDVNIESNLDDPFVIRKTPFSYLDSYTDDLQFTISLSAEVIPGLDSLDFGFPGATIDSIRIQSNTTRTEEATAWGTLTILGQEKEVLKTKETAITSTAIEIGLGVFGQIVWLDVGDLFGGGMGGFGGDQTTVTYKFLSNDDKRSVVEFTENEIVDTLGVVQSVVVTGRLSQEFLLSTADITEDKSDFLVYPNPTADYIILNHPKKERLEWACIFNTSGQIIHSEKPYYINKKIDTYNLLSGAYILLYKDGENIESKLFYKQ